MTTNVRALGAASALVLTACAGQASAATTTVEVLITGGHVTDPRDAGRPVVLVAGALGVPAEVFRTAFSGVTPAGAGQEPDPAQVKLNKAALLKVLAPYGITNDQLDAASNAYRYNGRAGQTWPEVAASAVATVKNGKVVSIRVTRGGSGYTSAPTITVNGQRASATLLYSKTLSKNGSLAAVTVRA